MSEHSEFLEWFNSKWREAEDALHDGDAGPRFSTWSEQEPVTLFGAWFGASGSEAVRSVFRRLAESFGGITSSGIDLVASGVSGDIAYTVHREVTSAIVEGAPRDYVLRVTQVYRREDGEWKVVHRHADPDPETATRPDGAFTTRQA